MLKFEQPGERKVNNLLLNKPQTQSAPEGGRKTVSMLIIMMMMMRMMMIRTSNRVGSRGGR